MTPNTRVWLWSMLFGTVLIAVLAAGAGIFGRRQEGQPPPGPEGLPPQVNAPSDPAYEAGLIDNAKLLGITSRELRGKYEALAERYNKPVEVIWGSHTRKLRRLHPDDAWIMLEAELKSEELRR